MHMCCCALLAGRVGCCGPAKWPPATKMLCVSGFTAAKAGWNGRKGGLEWSQEDPNYLWFTPFGEPKRLLTRGGTGAQEAANRLTRTPSGHPEGYLEAFANIYSEAADLIRALETGAPLAELAHVPTLEDGLQGMRVIDACVRSSEMDAAWTEV